MSLPSQILAGMVDAFRERLGDSVNEVRVHEGAPGTDPKNTIKGKDPLVLVTCLGTEMQPERMHIADGVWAAFVLTRSGSPSEDGQLGRSIYAGNIAVQLAAVIDDCPWMPLMYRGPTDTTVRNEHTEKLGKDAAWGMWSIAWRQPFEITRQDEVEMHRLASIHHTFVMGGLGDAPTPDAHATIEFPEPTP